MAVTAKDIARDLGLSQPTVSRILSGDVRARASGETRERVLEAARRLGYRPNAVASSLRRGRTGIVGLHTSHDYDARNEFLGAIIGGLQRACNAHGLDLLLHSALQGRSAEEMFGRLRDGRVDGLILHAGADDPLVAMLSESLLPVVSVADAHPGMAGVTCDDEAGVRALLKYLWGRGHRSFAFLAPRSRLASPERRREVFEDELSARGLPPQARRVLRLDFEDVGPVLGALLDGRERAEACCACCWNDRTAYNLLQAARERGVRVPRELAVAGFDGFGDDKIPAQQLTTVACPWPDVAARALEMLARTIEARGAERVEEEEGPLQVRLPVSLVEGDTA